MCVFLGATSVGSSGSGTSAEEVNFSFASPSAAPIDLHRRRAGLGRGRLDAVQAAHLGTWDGATAGNMTVTAPAAATIGGTGAINLSFSGLAAGTKYLGSVVYGGAAGMPSPTIVRVDTP